MENLQQKVFIMCGVPGSGKSTWINERYIWDYDALISRDAIRFAKLKPGQDYFAVENEVRKEFFNEIEEATNPNSKGFFENVFIDATHTASKARSDVRRHIKGRPYQIAVSFEVPLEVALERNAQRTGLAKVPESAIRNMYNRYSIPSLKEGFDEIWHIDAEGNIVQEVRVYE